MTSDPTTPDRDRHTSAVELLRGLSADEIRRRLTELDAESRALRTLLRAAIRMESGRQTRQEGRDHE